MNMHVMILAAGRGERMRPLTDKVPKPLLTVNGKSIIVYLIEALAGAGLSKLVVNYAHLGDQIVQLLGDGQEWGVHIEYSAETNGGLETGGGIFNALPLLKSDPFIIVNADIWTDFPFINLKHDIKGQAHLVLVDNPGHHPDGDFCLQGNSVSDDSPGLDDGGKLTYSGVAIMRHSLFSNSKPGVFPLAPLFRAAMTAGMVTGEHYQGVWEDIGTPGRLQTLNTNLAKSN